MMEWNWWAFFKVALVTWFILIPIFQHVWRYYWRGRQDISADTERRKS